MVSEDHKVSATACPPTHSNTKPEDTAVVEAGKATRACLTSEERIQSSSCLWLRHHRGIVIRCGAHKVNRNECLRMHQNWVKRSDVCRPAAMWMCEWMGGWMSWWMRREVMESIKLGSGVPSFKFLRVVATVYASNGNITYLFFQSAQDFL